MKKRTMKKRTMKKRTMKNSKMMSFTDVDYATDIDVLTIMSKDKQISALNKVKQYLKVCKNKNKQHVKEMTKRKKQIEELIKEN